MSRRKVFTDIVECVRWMLEKPGERWVKDKEGWVRKGLEETGIWVPTDLNDAPFTAVHDEHGDIPEEVELPELDEEFSDCKLNTCTSIGALTTGNSEGLKKLLQLTIAQAVRMANQKREGK